MKLLNCLECHDILSLILDKNRECRCGKSIGKYSDVNSVEYAGPARILHISNDDYAKAATADLHARFQWHVSIDGVKIRKVSRDSIYTLPDIIMSMGKQTTKQ